MKNPQQIILIMTPYLIISVSPIKDSQRKLKLSNSSYILLKTKKIGNIRFFNCQDFCTNDYIPPLPDEIYINEEIQTQRKNCL